MFSHQPTLSRLWSHNLLLPWHLSVRVQEQAKKSELIRKDTCPSLVGKEPILPRDYIPSVMGELHLEEPARSMHIEGPASGEFFNCTEYCQLEVITRSPSLPPRAPRYPSSIKLSSRDFPAVVFFFSSWDTLRMKSPVATAALKLLFLSGTNKFHYIPGARPSWREQQVCE